MPQNDEEFVNFVLRTMTDDVKRLGTFSNSILDSIDKQFNSVADQVRETLHSSTWVPEQIRPHPPAPPRSTITGPTSALECVSGWLHRNRAITAAVVAFLGTGTFLVWRQRRWRRQKRRARRAATGAKTEVVVLAGSPYSLLTQSLAMDFERRGFLVFVPVSSIEEETAVAAFRLPDVRPLNFDITSGESTEKMLESFAAYLENPHRHGTSQLHLASLVVADADTSAYPVGTIRAIPTSVWLDSTNSHIIYPISLIHTFLPLLLREGKAEHESRSTAPIESSVVLITQSNTSSIELPAHACESLSSAALASFARTLQAELPRCCQAVHVRVGAFDYEGVRRNGKIPDPSLIRSHGADRRGLTWPNSQFGRHTRELHLAVFDAMTGRSSGTVFVGPGARTYALMGALAPRNLIFWMMGYRGSRNIVESKWTGIRRRSHSNESSSGSDTGRSLEWEKVASG